MYKESQEIAQTRLELNRIQAVAQLEAYLQKPEEQILREHQLDAWSSLRDFLGAGETAGYINLPTGSGKSVIIAELAEAVGVKTLVLSPTLKILEQTGEKFSPGVKVTEKHGTSNDLTGQVVNATYQSVDVSIKRGVIDPSEFDLLICDEVHTALGPDRHKIFKNFPNALMVGLTATPFFSKLDGYKKREIVGADERWTGMFENLIHNMSLEEGIEREILTNLDVNIIRSGVKVGETRTSANGDYNVHDLGEQLNVWQRNVLTIGLLAGLDKLPAGVQISQETKDEIARMHELIKGRKTAIFGIDIEHIQDLSRLIVQAGLKPKVVHGQLSKNDRDKVFMDYENGEIDILLGVDLIRLGWDSPETEVGIYMSPTKSGVVATQELGRILRTHPGKEKAIAIQFADIFEGTGEAPVLIPNLFDPYFILRGSISYKDGKYQDKKNSGIKTKLKFSGIGIEAIVEQARTQEILRRRLASASFEELGLMISEMASRINSEDPEISPIEFYKKFASELPYRIGAAAQEKAIQAIASIDSNTVREGKKVLLMLGMGFAMTVVDKYLTGDNEKDTDMIHAGFLAFYEGVDSYRRNSVSRPVQDLVLSGVVSHIAEREGVPAGWVRKGTYKENKRAVQDIILMSSPEREQQIELLAEKNGETVKSIMEYIESLTALELSDVQAGVDGISLVGAEGDLKREIAEILDSLPAREQEVIKLRFGLEDQHHMTLREVAQFLGNRRGDNTISSARVSQIELKALKHLRHPSRARKISNFLDSDVSFGGPAWESDDYNRRINFEIETVVRDVLEGEKYERLKELPLESRIWDLVFRGKGLTLVGVKDEIDLAEEEQVLNAFKKYIEDVKPVNARVVIQIPNFYYHESLSRMRNWVLDDPSLRQSTVLVRPVDDQDLRIDSLKRAIIKANEQNGSFIVANLRDVLALVPGAARPRN